MAAAATWRSPQGIADLRKGATLSALLIIVTGILLAIIFDDDTPVAVSAPPIGMIIVLFAIQLIAVPAIALFGFLKQRRGLAVGALLPPAFILVSSAALVGIDVARIQPLLSREFLPPSHQHEIVVLDRGVPECEALCVELLARSNYAVAVRYGHSDAWRVFRKVEGKRCSTTDGVDAINFIRLGFVGVCSTEAEQPRIGDALIIQKVIHDHGIASEFLPRSFQGVYSDLIERTAGRDQLLGRWIEGSISSSSQFDWLVSVFETGPVEVAPHSGYREFYTAALGIQFSSSYPPGTADLAARLDALEPLLLEGKPGSEARELYVTMAGAERDKTVDVIVPRVRRLLQNGNAGMVETGAAVIVQMESAERFQFGPDLGLLLGHGNPKIVGAALSALLKFPEAERAFARQALIDTAFSPVLHHDDGTILDPLVRHLQSLQQRFPPDIRSRAINAILRGTDLSHAERRVLLTVIAHGGAEESQQAVDAVFSLQGTAFENSVAAVGGPQEKSILDGGGWSDADLRRLLERSAQVPSGRLKRYIDCLRSQHSFAPLKPRLSLLIRERLEAAEAAAPRDEKEIDALRYLLSINS